MTRKIRDKDWAACERDYRTGKYTFGELEKMHGISRSRICRVANAGHWIKDLSAAVRAATRAAVSTETASLRGVAAGRVTAKIGSLLPKNESEVIAVAAEIGLQVIMEHRSELQQARELAMKMLRELDAASLTEEQKELLAEILAGEKPTPQDLSRAREAIHTAIALGSRVRSVKDLADTLSKLHSGERRAFALDETERETATFEDDLRDILEKHG